MIASGLLGRVRSVLPEGRPLPDDVWRLRHRGILVLLWLHATGIVAFALIRGYSLPHSLFEGSLVAAAALLAGVKKGNRTFQATMASLGLMTSSAVLVHLSGGYIEMHFHFFVMIAVMTLYQDWTPFLMAIAYVVIHHGTLGVLAPASVYNHSDAWAHPWKWAGIHGVFVLGASLASLVAWRLNEEVHARTELILDSVGEGMFGLDLAGNTTFVNPAAARMLGYEPRELIGRPMHRVMHHSRPDGTPYPRDECPIYRAFRIGLVQQVTDEVFWRKDGTSFRVEYTSTPIRERDRIVGAVVTFQDITRRKQAEELVGKLSKAIEQTADHVMVTDRAGVIEYVNVAFEEATGYTREEAIGRTPRILKSGRQDQGFYEALWSTILSGQVFRAVLRNKKKNGELYYAEKTITPIADGQGNITHFISTDRDITARQRAEEEIRRLNTSLEQRVAERTAQLARRQQELDEAKAFLEHLIASSPVVIFRGRPGDGSLTYVSANLQKILGYTPEEALEVPGFWLQRIHPEHHERVFADRQRTLETKTGTFEYEVPFLRKDGSYVWLYCVVRFEYDEAGTPVSVLGYALDVSARKAVEEGLTQAKAEAERASLAKSEFLSRMSHELRTPMNAILGFAQLLEMDNPTPEARESIEHILKGGQHLLQLINEVLDIARIEAGRLVISPEPVLLWEVVQESLDLIAPLAAQRQVQLNADLALTYEGHVQADRQRLKQVLLNLLSNAVKYNRQGGAVVLSCEETLRGRLRVKVSDTGRGIPPEQLERLFLPFERLGVERSGIDGAGIGLAVSKGLIELMGGDIGVESEVGQGSTFWVDLAMAESPTERYQRMREEAPLPAAADGGILLRSLLYIEDNLANLELIQSVLDRWPQVKLLSAMQGRLGLELACQHRPDLILLDLHLPDVTGDELLRRLRETPETQRIPVVVITADASQGQVDRLLAIGARDFLTKPLDVKRLLKVLSEPLKERTHTHP